MKNELYFDSDLYGSYRNKSYSDIFPDVHAFQQSFATSGLKTILTPEQLAQLYYLLYSEYGDAPIANSNENVFRYQIMVTCNSDGAVYLKKIDIQNEVILMRDEDVEKGNTQINNTALNPSVAPTTQTLEELEHINSQNVFKSKRGKIEGYQAILRILDEDLTKNFLQKFRRFFLTFRASEGALWYETLKPNIPIEQEEN